MPKYVILIHLPHQGDGLKEWRCVSASYGPSVREKEQDIRSDMFLLGGILKPSAQTSNTHTQLKVYNRHIIINLILTFTLWMILIKHMMILLKKIYFFIYHLLHDIKEINDSNEDL